MSYQQMEQCIWSKRIKFTYNLECLEEAIAHAKEIWTHEWMNEIKNGFLENWFRCQMEWNCVNTRGCVSWGYVYGISQNEMKKEIKSNWEKKRIAQEKKRIVVVSHITPKIVSFYLLLIGSRSHPLFLPHRFESHESSSNDTCVNCCCGCIGLPVVAAVPVLESVWQSDGVLRLIELPICRKPRSKNFEYWDEVRPISKKKKTSR